VTCDLFEQGFIEGFCSYLVGQNNKIFSSGKMKSIQKYFIAPTQNKWLL
jgi:hypothetical protein